MNEHQTAALGQEARALLDSQAYTEAMDRLREDVRQQWMSAPVRDLEGQRLLLITAKLVEKLDAQIRGMVEAGKLAQSRIDINDLRDENGIRRAVRRVIS